MSTTFAIFRIPVTTNEYGEVVSEYTEDDYLEVAFRGNGGHVYWYNKVERIQQYFLKQTPVYPLDNTPQGIYTIQDIRDEIDKQ